MYQNIENVNTLAISELTENQLNEVSGGGCPVAAGLAIAAGVVGGAALFALATVIREI
ncbi:class IIb bacteriocin, lactobin A/cerein 7B family [Alteromonadaceae bacterium M269]|nr:class IIb bacteriocin, lactobin A/cerein 7B family [Alteromonadaceae bacterium M269]